MRTSGKSSYWDYHTRQYERQYRSTVSVSQFIGRHLPDEPAEVLDVGCGGGANSFWLAQRFPQWSLTGIDLDREALALARDRNPAAKFVEGDFLDAETIFGAQSFDYVFGIQFVTSVPFALEAFLDAARATARNGIVMTGLFTEGDIEQYTTAIDKAQEWEGLYKIYSLKRIISWCEKNNANMYYEKFEIDIDLPAPDKPSFGTYTVKTDKNERLQISGYMLMPWYNIFLKMF